MFKNVVELKIKILFFIIIISFVLVKCYWKLLKTDVYVTRKRVSEIKKFDFAMKVCLLHSGEETIHILSTR